MPRNYFRCSHCQWALAWGFVPSVDFTPPESNRFSKGDPDMGLMIGMHVEVCHSEMLYGLLIPASVLTKVLEAARR